MTGRRPMTRLEHNPKRCKHTARQRDGSVVECLMPGDYVLDREAKTWRPARPTDKARRCWTHGPGSVAKPAGRGGRRKVQPNAKLQRIAALVLGCSTETTRALTDISDELAMLGFPSKSSRGISAIVDNDGPVSRDAVRSVELASWREDIRDAIEGLGDRVDAYIHLLRQVRNVGYAAHGVKLCSESQQGRQGSIEWGDPTCTELPTKGGLCPRCYQAERRWRTEHELPTSEVPAA